MENNQNIFSKKISIRWSDLDPNNHIRHSVYYDFCTQQRIEILEENGLSIHRMQEEHIGPVIFREQCIFKKEIRLHDTVILTAEVLGLREDGSRYAILHKLHNQLGQLCAEVTIEGSWMDLKKRKLADPPPLIAKEIMNKFPRSDQFQLIP